MVYSNCCCPPVDECCCCEHHTIIYATTNTTGQTGDRRPVGRTVHNAVPHRSLTGIGNNPEHPTWGAANFPVARRIPEHPQNDRQLQPRGLDGPVVPVHPRRISTVVMNASDVVPNTDGMNDMVWLWGQFMDHLFTETPAVSNPDEKVTIEITADDDPELSGYHLKFAPTARPAPAFRPINNLSSFIDAANVYGNTEERCAKLRAMDGTGRLRLDPVTGLLPKGSDAPSLGMANEGESANSHLFLAGDVRANEHALLLSMHTLFAWEHNYWAEYIASTQPRLAGQDETLFQLARCCVSVIMQQITFGEFLPKVLGSRTRIPPYTGFKPDVDPTMSEDFTACAFRVGHTWVGQTLRVGDDEVRLKDVFFNPSAVTRRAHVEDYLAGALRHTMQEPMGRMNDDMRTFLFNKFNSNSKEVLDLAVLNVLRGRDHKLPSFNTWRNLCGLTPIESVEAISSNAETRSRLVEVFGSGADGLDNIDAFVGGIVEDRYNGGLVGELFNKVILDQFLRIRDGDNLWHFLPRQILGETRKRVMATRLADVLKRHLGSKFVGSTTMSAFLSR